MKKQILQKIFRMNSSFSILYSLPIILLLACKGDNQNEPQNKEASENKISSAYIIQKAIEYSGKEKIKDNKVTFEFRNKTYISDRVCNHFHLTRIDSSNQIKDVFYKDEIKRRIKGKSVSLADTTSSNIKSSINSVHYFVHLPYRLKDPAVQAQRLKNDTINDQAYYQLQVKFKEDGGGEDHQDIYHYWFDQEDFSLDYLAYKFYTNDGGMRFRAKRVEKRFNGIVFQDYDNFKPTSDTLQMDELITAYQNNQMEKVSEIVTTPISISPSKHDCD